MPFSDSIDKIIQVYFRSVTKVTFTYKNVTYTPRNLTVSPLLLRGFTCPEKCGGCCPRFSLDYLFSETRPDYINKTRIIEIDNKKVEIYSDMQEDRVGEHFCRNLNMTDGRCNIHGIQPFSCDFELVRFFVSEDEETRLSQQLFGRGWNFLRIDSERGALCSMTPVDTNTTKDVIRKLKRLEEWLHYFGIYKHWIPEILHWIHRGDAEFPLQLSLDRKKGLLDV